MIYRGYRIVKEYHPTPIDSKYTGYDIQRDGEVIKANFKTVEGARLCIDLMVKLGRWPDLKQK